MWASASARRRPATSGEGVTRSSSPAATSRSTSARPRCQVTSSSPSVRESLEVTGKVGVLLIHEDGYERSAPDLGDEAVLPTVPLVQAADRCLDGDADL